MANKYCVFCGQKPNNKTKEHVIPHWLIALTGDPNRKVNLGLLKEKGDQALKQRQYSFDSFTFPACEKCNHKYSELEGKAKYIIEKILSDEVILSDEMSILLDWFDKVRVGLWLGYHQLDKNIADINPGFHIATRIGQYDRALFISKSDNPSPKLNFGGADTIAFAYTPSAFTLIINNYYFANISYNFLFSRRIGFPYPKKIIALADEMSDSRVEADIDRGIGRVMHPLIRFPVGAECVEIYQPMFKGDLIEGEVAEYYDGYVEENSLDFENGVGAIYRGEGKKFSRHLSGEEINCTPERVYIDEEIFYKSAINVLKWQNYLNSLQPDLSQLPKEQRSYRKKHFKAAARINEALIKLQERSLKNL